MTSPLAAARADAQHGCGHAVERIALCAAARWYARHRRTLDVCVELADLEQEARIAVWRASQRYDPNYGASLATFVYQAAHGAVQNHARDRSHIESRTYQRIAKGEIDGTESDLPPVSLDRLVGESQELHKDLLVDEREGPSEAFEQESLRSALWAAVEALPPHLREPVELCFREGVSQKEAGRRTGVSQMQICRRLAEALCLLRGLAGVGLVEQAGRSQHAVPRSGVRLEVVEEELVFAVQPE